MKHERFGVLLSDRTLSGHRAVLLNPAGSFGFLLRRSSDADGHLSCPLTFNIITFRDGSRSFLLHKEGISSLQGCCIHGGPSVHQNTVPLCMN